MHKIKTARKLIEADPLSETSKTLAKLVRGLESEESFNLGDLYKLNYEDFNLAIDVMEEWRLARYYSGKAKLHGLSVQVAELTNSI